jgi:hypothetical protein
LFLLGCGWGVDAGVVRRAELGGQFLVMRAGILSRAGGDFRRKQAEDEAVFVGAPDSPILPQETRSGALLAAEATRAVKKARGKPLEANRHFPKLAIEAANHPVDEAAADQGLADDRAIRPLRAVGQQITDRNRKVMIRVQQSDPVFNITLV